MNIDEQTKILLLYDYKKVQDCIAGVLEEQINHPIVHDHYLSPSISGEQIPFNDENGEYKYFSRIRTALELAIIDGKIPKGQNLLPTTHPDYLSRLMQ